jgi:hypothetical protein
VKRGRRATTTERDRGVAAHRTLTRGSLRVPPALIGLGIRAGITALDAKEAERPVLLEVQSARPSGSELVVRPNQVVQLA